MTLLEISRAMLVHARANPQGCSAEQLARFAHLIADAEHRQATEAPEGQDRISATVLPWPFRARPRFLRAVVPDGVA